MSRDQLLSHTTPTEFTPDAPGADTATDQEFQKTPDQTFLLAFWFELIDERPASEFVNLKPRTLQGLRYRGGGPPFVRLSARCVKYRRIDLLRWAEARLRTSTSDRPEDV